MDDTSRRLIFVWVLGAHEALETFVGVFNVTHPVVRHNQEFSRKSYVGIVSGKYVNPVTLAYLIHYLM